MAKINFFGKGKCGCVTCKDGETRPEAALDRHFWTGKVNKHRHNYGRTKPGGRKQRKSVKITL